MRGTRPSRLASGVGSVVFRDRTVRVWYGSKVAVRSGSNDHGFKMGKIG